MFKLTTNRTLQFIIESDLNKEIERLRLLKVDYTITYPNGYKAYNEHLK